MTANLPSEVAFEFLDEAEGGLRLTLWAGGSPSPLSLETSEGECPLLRAAGGMLGATLRFKAGSGWVRLPASGGCSAKVGQFFPCGRVYRHSSCRVGSLVVRWVGDRLVFERASAVRMAWRRLRFLVELACSRDKGARKAAAVRVVVAACRLFRRRRLWLVSDRLDSGGDSGEVLFRFLRRNLPDVDVRFVVSRDSPSFAALAEVGPVVPAESPRRKILTLLADLLISSQAERAFSNPFAGYSEPYRDLLAGIPLVFLQHGVIKDDLSAVLGRRERNFSGFVVSAVRERDSVLNGPYGYGAESVWLTGLPRFDLLESRPDKRILVMPTWRLGLLSDRSEATGRWILKDGFRESEFFRFYSALLADERLLDACRRTGYGISLVLHPNFAAAREFFRANDVVEVDGGGTSYGRWFAVGSLLVTDYSSTAFDFAYLRKPVVYAQFDADSFFAGGHTYGKGYFDYASDGFGEVEATVEATVARIVGYLESGCALKAEYRRRIDGFFAYGDRENCRRVAAKLVELAGGAS